MNLRIVDAALHDYFGFAAGTLSTAASPELAILLAWVSISALLLGIYFNTVHGQILRRLNGFVRAQTEVQLADVGGQRGALPQMVDVLDRRLARRRTIASLRMKLARAGLGLTVTEFLTLRIVSAVTAGLIVGTVMAFRIGWPAAVAGLVAALAGSFLPNVVLGMLTSRRTAALEKQLPNGLDIVASSLQAGTGLSQGFATLSREMTPPISVEFAQVQQEVNLGLSMTEALTNLSNRANSEELDLVVTSIIIQMRVGGNLVHVLRTAANTIRERMALKGEIRVLTSQQRFSAIVIGILPPGVALVLWFLSPQYMGGLLMPGITRIMLVAGVGMQLAGLFLLRKISEIDV